MIAFNCRNRVSKVTNYHAGNYLFVAMNPDLKSPITSRNWVNNILKPGFSWSTPKSIEVNDCESFVSGAISNWASCYRQAEIPGFVHKNHFPVLTQELRALHSIDDLSSLITSDRLILSLIYLSDAVWSKESSV